jgi:cysteinyl-tRNA synthetase
MSMSYLGDALDIHGGGQDLVFPHHENETAQSEAYSGTVPFARYWVHNGLLHMGEDKMSKSLGNLVSLEEVLKTHSPDALRIFFLSSHYRSPLNYSEDSHVSTERAAERLRNALREGPANDTDTLGPEPYKQAFIQAMDSDLNTPQALGAIFDLAREINRAKESGRGVAQAQGTLRELGGVLGLTFSHPGEARGESATPFIDLLVDTRTELRAARQYALADQIRDRLAGLGVVLEDTPQGTSWRYGG